MSQQGDVFEPTTILAILKAAQPTQTAKAKFEKDWAENIRKRVNSWKANKDNRNTPEIQLQFEAAVVEYTDYLRGILAVNKKSKDKSAKLFINNRGIPLLGPRFVPPTYMHIWRRDATPKIIPETAYIKPVTVIHWVFYPTALTGKCPQCDSSDTLWDSWNATGARDVYGLKINERAIGYQLRCKSCKAADAEAADPESKMGFCFATTNRVFWDKWERWRIPSSIPYFFKRAAVSHELYQLIAEFRLSSTSAGLAEHIKQLHLLEYQQRFMEYLQHFKAAHSHLYQAARIFTPFSTPTDPNNYNNVSITNDFITEVYLDFVTGTGGRQNESVHYGKTRGAKSISVDNTFKSAAKATVVSKDKQRESPMHGGILSALNELNEGLAWRYCMTASPIEIQELLAGIAGRLRFMELPKAHAVIVDNCCTVRRFIEQAFGKGILVFLDVFHFIRRYGAVIHRGTKNPFQRQVLASIKDAIIKTSSKKGQPAMYWSREEQEFRLADAYNKWARKGNVWSAAAPKVHADQLEHVHKGCLARPDNIQDIALDGSRIEGSHKGWNSIQRSFSSGLEMYTALAHDHFHRRNIRIGTARVETKRKDINLPEFIQSLNGSHYVHLVNYISQLSNSLITKKTNPESTSQIILRPILPAVHDSETFGLVESHHSTTYGGLVTGGELENTLAESEDLGYDPLLDDRDSDLEEAAAHHVLRTLGLDECLVDAPLERSGLDMQGKKRKEPDQANSPAQVGELESHSTDDGVDMPGAKRRRYDVRPFTPGNGADATVIDDNSDPGTQAMAAINCEPSENVIQRTSDIVAPSDTAGSKVMRASWAFMPTSRKSGTSHVDNGSAVQRLQVLGSSLKTAGSLSVKQLSTAELLQRRLPLPANLQAKGLTRSQLLFSVGTTIDIRSLAIETKEEFYLFMDMRKEYQWTTFSMTMERWATATEVYNNRLQAIIKDKQALFIKKYPQALQKKLSVIEDIVIARLAKEDYKSRSGDDRFWKTHCEAVPALKVKAEPPKLGAEKGAEADGDAEADAGADGTKAAAKKPRKRATCTRCCAKMYGCAGVANHNKGYCLDGGPQKAKKTSIDLSVPKYPQPLGIFEKGIKFNVASFLAAVHDLYERIIEHETVKGESATPYDSDTILEDLAFSEMLQERTTVVDGHSYFLLFDGLELSLPSNDSLISTFNGRKYLRMDCL